MLAFLITAGAASMTPTLEVTARSLDQDGVRANYTRTVEADGTIHLRGRYEDNSRTPFHFRVRGDMVRGTVHGLAVAFPRPRSK